MAEKEKVYGVKPKIVKKDTTKTEVYSVIFTLLTVNKETKIAIGNKIISKLTFESTKEAKKYIDSKPWELLINAPLAINDIINEQKH